MVLQMHRACTPTLSCRSGCMVPARHNNGICKQTELRHAFLVWLVILFRSDSNYFLLLININMLAFITISYSDSGQANGEGHPSE